MGPMGAQDNETDSIFSLPVAYALQNGSGIDSILEFHNHTLTTDVARKTIPIYRLEKIGDTVKKELKWGFILHTYGFGCLFFILAFYAFFSILNLRSFLSSRPFMSTINGFLCLLGASRSGSLLIDPYNFKETMPKMIGQILWDLGFPSIISAFCLVQLAFLQLTQLKLGPEGLRRKSYLSLIVTAHFTLTIAVDIAVVSHENLLMVKYVVQYIFLAWGVFLCCSFLYSGYKVMSIIRNIPGGFRRDLPDPNHKGIMQLAMLAPYNTLGGSVTAALLPTLCAPKIHQQDSNSTSTLGFRNESNSRILESESIPILEEIAGSSGDERSPQSVSRASSFQNQTRNSQKFNLKPKLSLKNGEEQEVGADESPPSSTKLIPKSPKTMSPKSPKFRSNSKFDFNQKWGNGILKNTETFVTTKDINEFKSKIQHRNSFENENFRFPNERKSSSGNVEKPIIEVRPPSPSNEIEITAETNGQEIPNITISCPSRRNSSEQVTEEVRTEEGREDVESDPDSITKNEEDFNKIINQIKEDLKQMDMDRGEKKDEDKTASKLEVKKKTSMELSPRKNSGASERRISDVSIRRLSDARRGSEVSEPGSRRNSCRRDSNRLIVETVTSRRSSECSAFSEITECEDSPITSPKNDKKKGKTLSWRKKLQDEKDESAVQESLLPQEGTSNDVSLSAILNHIAYVNRAALSAEAAQDDVEKGRKSQVEWVLNVTYITAMWGLMLCLSNMGRISTPYSASEDASNLSQPNNTTNLPHSQAQTPDEGIWSSPWPWLWFQTFCRGLELAMGCAMANITRQPTANSRSPHIVHLRQRRHI